MKLQHVLLCGLAGGVFAAGVLFAAGISSSAVYVPDAARANGALPDNVFLWNSVSLSTNATEGQAEASFVFSFTNIAKGPIMGTATNFTTVTNTVTRTNRFLWFKKISHVPHLVTVTNIVSVTNSIEPVPVTIFSAHPSCGCTTAQLPKLPWTIPPGGTGQFGVKVNLLGKNGTIFKSVKISTDEGSKDLYVRITIIPKPASSGLTDAERAQGVAMATADRQAIFRGDCATCHVKPGEGLYGEALYKAVCAVCHEAEHRATMVPDLHNLKVPTNDEFWRTWIAHGKPGSLMAAFSTSDGGPLNDMQIASLAAYLNYAFPSQVPQTTP